MADRKILIGVIILGVIGIVILIYNKDLTSFLETIQANKLKVIEKQSQVNTYFEDCESLTDWVITPLLSWTSSPITIPPNAQCKGGFANPYGNMTSINFSLLNYKNANLSFIYSYNNFTSNNARFRIYLNNGSSIINIFEKNATNINSVPVTNQSINISLNSIYFSNNVSLTAQCEGGVGTRGTCNWDNINITGDDGICIVTNNGQDPLETTIPCNNCRLTSNVDGSLGTIIISNASGVGLVTAFANITNYLERDINYQCGINQTIGVKT